MKTLQNNFTTPEQSNRLLELGVPANSADCYYFNKEPIKYLPKYELKFRDNGFMYGKPCWSVGRLIEIYLLLREVDEFEYVFNLGRDHIEDIVRMYEKTASKLDFSKLEE